MKEKQLETIITHYGEDRTEHVGAVVPPIYQNSLFTFPDWEAIDKAFDDPVSNCIYTRGKNPTVSLAEEKLAKIAGGEKAKLFSSGMGAITSAIMHYIKSGDHVITLNNIYGPASNFFNSYLSKKFNVEITYISGTKIEEFEQSIRENTKLIYIESPATAVFSLQDITAVAELAKKNNINTIIDNTWATPVFQKPIEMGIDLEVHSCSKYIGGHSDIVAGVVIGKEKDIDEIFLGEHALFGAKLAPFEAWLITRSLRTLPIRMLKHQENAARVVAFLKSHKKIKSVLYPGLSDFPQYELGKKQMTGYTGLMGFEIASENLQEIKNFFNALDIFKIGVSWGGHESLIFAPAIGYLKELPPEQFKNMGISLGTMRISVGLENADDLIDDLENALRQIN
ncbi:MAG TPA: aminotransferase class I/II-fold pyridoxal phosphate-dependent enzyme [Victivallales bacterium]|nr:aminotransferase class I/II-fold pyridoxal phosphate-dependent enzyme [Victivallales bacterium]